VPPGLIEHQQGMLVRANGPGKLAEIDLHSICRDLGQDQGEGVVRAWFHSSVEIGESVALIAPARRALAPDEPAVADTPFLANPGFVLKKQADFLARMSLTNLFQAL
jgi:hypothetical protein